MIIVGPTFPSNVLKVLAASFMLCPVLMRIYSEFRFRKALFYFVFFLRKGYNVKLDETSIG
jgi:hypothetical protein